MRSKLHFAQQIAVLSVFFLTTLWSINLATSPWLQFISDPGGEYLSAAIGLIAAVLGSALVLKAHRRRGVLALCGMLACFTLYVQGGGFLPALLPFHPIKSAPWMLPFLAVGGIAFFLTFALSLGSLVPARRSSVTSIWVGSILFGMLMAVAYNVMLPALYNSIASATSGRAIHSTVVNRIYITVGPFMFDPIIMTRAFLGGIWVIGMSLVGLLGFHLLHTRYVESESIEDRRRIAWVGVAVMVGVFASTFMILLPHLQRNYWGPMYFVVGFDERPAVGLLATMLILAIAMFGKGAIDSELVVRRTAVYGFATFAGIFVFAGVENILVDHLATMLDLPPDASTWISAGTAAIAITYARNWASKRIKGIKPWGSAKLFAAEESSLQAE